MNTKLTAPLAIVAAGAALFVAGCGDDTDTSSKASDTAAQTTAEMPKTNVVEAAIATPDLSTLVTAVQAADLVETLSGKGPFTVFAPTNEAFEALPEGTLDDLLKPAKKDDLSAVLTYHVVPGTYTAADLSDGQELTTVNGKKLTVNVKDGAVMVGDATVAQADLKQSNGVVHVIDAVLLP